MGCFMGTSSQSLSFGGGVVDTCFADGAGVINYRKTVVERLDRHPVGHEILLAVAVALYWPPRPIATELMTLIWLLRDAAYPPMVR